MSDAVATSTRWTMCPLMSRPRMASAFASASSGVSASLTPPALPRPPVLTWAFTTTVVPYCSASALASAGVLATSPGSTGTLWAAKRSFAWYSYRSTRVSCDVGVGHRVPGVVLEGPALQVEPRARSSGAHTHQVPPGTPAEQFEDR